MRYLLSLFLFFIYFSVSSQNNLDFENGSFTGWNGSYGYQYSPQQYSGIQQTTSVTGYIPHAIMSSGNDQYAGSAIPTVCPWGGKYSVRLGDPKGYCSGTLSQTFKVSSSNACLMYSYAVMLQNYGHPTNMQPYFQIRIYDGSNNEINCATYDVNATTASSIGGFVNISGSSTSTGAQLTYSKWTQVLVPLDSYIGQNVTIEFEFSACQPGPDIGYAYIDCEANPLEIVSSSPSSCGGQSFTLTAPVGAQTYSWSGPGGFSGSTQVVTANDPGTYTCTILSKNTSGVNCTSDLSITITGNPTNPNADFSYTGPCTGTVTQFTDASTISGSTIKTWQWDFGDGNTSTQQNPTNTYSSTGNYTVSLTVTTKEGCDATTTQTVKISNGPTLSLTTTDENCSKQDGTASVTASGGSGTYTYQWSTTPKQTTSTASGLVAGTYTVSVDDGVCAATSKATVSAKSGPTLKTNSTTEYCGASDGTATVTASGGTSSNYTYSWNTTPIQTTATAINLSAGNYKVTVDDGICNSTSTVTVGSSAAPTLTFTTTNEQCGAKNGTATVKASGGTGTYAYAWNTGASTSSVTNLAAGTYSISVNDGFCTTVDSTVVSSNNSPILIMNKTDENCLQGDGTVTATVSGGTGTYSYLWNNGSTASALINVSSGIYSVNVDDGICKVSSSITINTSVVPTSNFTTKNVCLYDDAIFTNTSTISLGTISSYQWYFGDGNNSTQQSPTHSFSNSGIYNVNLIAVSGSNCVDTSSQSITIFAVPQASITTTNVCDMQEANFMDVSKLNGSTINAWQWNFETGSSSIEQNPSVVFSTFGKYSPSLIVTTTDGCSDTATTSIEIYPVPIADYTTNNVCLNELSSFTNLSYLSSGTMTYQWDFGDSASSNMQSPTHQFTQSNMYNVRLIPTSDKGCADTITQVLTIYPLPDVNFIPNQYNGCIDLDIYFTNNTTITSTNISSYIWNFGDGTTSSQQSPNHQFNNSGIYNIYLTATSDKGCVNTNDTAVVIEAYSLPVADFSYAPDYITIMNPNVEFTDLSSDASVWNWVLGDGSSSTEQNPKYTYADTGNYNIELWISNINGCVDSISKSLRVEPEFMIYIPNTFTPNNDGVNDQFYAKGWGIIELNMNIFDRWGNRIYTSSGVTATWNGTINENNAQEDVYIYEFNVKDVFNTQHFYNGKVSLVR